MRRLIERWGAKQAGLLDGVGLASAIGLHLVSGIIVGGLIGYWLDRWLDTSPWLKIVFFALGVAAGFRNVYLDAKILIAAQEKKHDQPPGRGGQPEDGQTQDGQLEKKD